MRKRLKYGIVIAVGVFAVGVGVVLVPSREPSYGGKKLSEWVLQSCTGGLGADVRIAQAEDAIRHIGTNAVPYLLAWGRYRMPPWRVRLAQAANKLPQS